MNQELEQPIEETIIEENPIEEKKSRRKKMEEPKEITLSDLHGVGPATVEKLEAVGFNSLMSVAVATPGEVIDATGISQASAKKLIAAARASLEMGFESGEELLERRSKIIKLTTGVEAFDEILGGGMETGCITECFGQYGSSKTQIAHQLAVNTQLPNDRGEEPPTVVYIDTENTFRPERIKQMAEAKGLDPMDVLKNIKVAKAYNSDHQMILAEKVGDLITKKGFNVKLVIVDSLTGHFRAEFVGRGSLAERQQKLNKHMHVLSRLADMHNLCVYVTNQVMSKPDQFFGDPTEAIGGHIVGHNSAFRIYLRKGKKGTRVAKLIDSPNLPESEAIFNVVEGGIVPV